MVPKRQCGRRVAQPRERAPVWVRAYLKAIGLWSSTLRTPSVGGGLKAPKGGHRRLPHFGKAFEEGKSRKGMNPRQETVPHLSSGVAECGKHNQRKAGGLEAPQSSLEASKSRLEAPKSRPGGSKIKPWGLQNRAWSPPRRHF